MGLSTISAESFSNVVKSLYAAAVGTEDWSDALRQLEDFTGSAGAIVDFESASPDLASFCLSGRFPMEQCAEFAVNYMPICKRNAAARENPDRSFLCDSMLLSESEMDRDPVYEWFGTMGLRYFVGGGLGQAGPYRSSFSLQRSRRQGHAEADDIEMFKLIRPHVAHAITLAANINNVASVTRIAEASLGGVRKGVIALEASGRIVFANGHAETLLSEADGLRASNGILVTSMPSSRRKLEALIRSAAEPALKAAGGWLRIERPSGRPPLAVFVSHFAASAALSDYGRAAVLLTIHSPYDRQPADGEALRAIFGLTHTEAAIAVALSAGHDTASTSLQLGVTVGTVRVHIKAIFRKLGINRQQDLVQIVSNLGR